MERHLVKTDQAPAAIGPYSQAVCYNGILYAAGQIPLDPATGHLVTESFELQVRRVLENLRAVCEACGTSLDQALKVNIYLTNLSDFAELNKIYAEYFGEAKPARATVEVSALPRDAAVEMDLIAACPKKAARG